MSMRFHSSCARGLPPSLEGVRISFALGSFVDAGVNEMPPPVDGCPPPKLYVWTCVGITDWPHSDTVVSLNVPSTVLDVMTPLASRVIDTSTSVNCTAYVQ